MVEHSGADHREELILPNLFMVGDPFIEQTEIDQDSLATTGSVRHPTHVDISLTGLVTTMEEIMVVLTCLASHMVDSKLLLCSR